MIVPPSWDAGNAIRDCPHIVWHGTAWRFHRKRYSAVDPGGSLRVSGRYHRGLDQLPPGQAWPALYLALGPEVCLGEIVRHVSPETLPLLNDYRLTELEVRLSVVVDCRDVSRIGLTPETISQDTDFGVTQAIGAAALAEGSEAILIPSATNLGDILVVLPTRLRTESRIEIISTRDARLYVARR